LPYLVFDGSSHLAAGRKNIKIRIAGGTNVSKSPSIEYIQHVLLPTLHKIGLPSITATLEKRGWSTGRTEMGSVMFSIDPIPAGSKLPAFSLVDRGDITHIEAYALAPAACKKDVENQLQAQVHQKFGQDITLDIHIEDSRNPKRLHLLLVAVSENGHRLGRDWLYDNKIRSLNDAVPKLVKKVIEELDEEIQHGGCVDEYMRDQLVVFQALANGRSQVDAGKSPDGKVVEASLHALTAYWVAFQVLAVEFDREGICNGCGMEAKGPVN
jgi:RNA 3'-terminal phosphate cyclase (ATP)